MMVMEGQKRTVDGNSRALEMQHSIAAGAYGCEPRAAKEFRFHVMALTYQTCSDDPPLLPLLRMGTRRPWRTNGSWSTAMTSFAYYYMQIATQPHAHDKVDKATSGNQPNGTHARIQR